MSVWGGFLERTLTFTSLKWRDSHTPDASKGQALGDAGVVDTLGITKILTLVDGGGFTEIDRVCGDGH